MPQRRNTPSAGSRTRHIRAAGAVVALAACSADRTTGPNVAPTAAAFSTGASDGMDAPKRMTDAQLTAAAATFHTTAADVQAPTTAPLPISCGVTGRYMVSQRIGKAGGSLRFGRSEFRVPSGALTADVQITADISLSREGVTVNFGPHGLKFAKAAEVRADFTGCTVPSGAALNVYYTDAEKRIVQTMPSSYTPGSTQIRSLTDHFSGYVVSWGRTTTTTSRR